MCTTRYISPAAGECSEEMKDLLVKVGKKKHKNMAK